MDKLSGPRASNVIRIEAKRRALRYGPRQVWFTESEDQQAIGTLRKNVERCGAPRAA